jgi:hypothetical protein
MITSSRSWARLSASPVSGIAGGEQGSEQGRRALVIAGGALDDRLHLAVQGGEGAAEAEVGWRGDREG